ncbi:MAG: hypothetical protein AAF490_05835 [Chloroflexota bacterium]
MNKRILPILLGFIALLTVFSAVFAHQPFFEDADFTFEAPWRIADVSVSTAVYATLDRSSDIDYYVFSANQDQTIQIEMTIPQVVGLEAFAPTMALIGPGLPEANLPEAVKIADGHGAIIIEPTDATEFYEPFGGQYYWDRQEDRIPAPETADYFVAVWHEDGEIGRYVFVAGAREIPGGDPAYRSKIEAYWTLPEPIEEEDSVGHGSRCYWSGYPGGG